MLYYMCKNLVGASGTGDRRCSSRVPVQTEDCSRPSSALTLIVLSSRSTSRLGGCQFCNSEPRSVTV